MSFAVYLQQEKNTASSATVDYPYSIGIATILSVFKSNTLAHIARQVVDPR
jgi:hypothetical protein